MTNHVLVVDDDHAIREMVQDVLELEGYRVTTAANGQEALTRVAESPPTVVLLDLQMPVLDGWAVQAQLRENRPDIPVVLMTAGYRARQEATRHGAAAYLTKPFDIDDLVTTVERFALTS